MGIWKIIPASGTHGGLKNQLLIFSTTCTTESPGLFLIHGNPISSNWTTHTRGFSPNHGVKLILEHRFRWRQAQAEDPAWLPITRIRFLLRGFRAQSQICGWQLACPSQFTDPCWQRTTAHFCSNTPTTIYVGFHHG